MTGAPARIGPRDEAPHEHGDEPGWSERLSFNFFDPEHGYGGIARVEFRPREKTADGALHLFLPDRSVASVLVREATSGGGASVGRLRLDPVAALERWKIRCTDVALVFAGGDASGLAAGRVQGSASPVDIDLAFETWMAPEGSIDRRTEVAGDGFVRTVSSGHFEQAGSCTGSIRVGPRRTSVSATGVRDRSWGPPPETATHLSRWFAVAFGRDLALAARVVRMGERTLRSGWVCRDGEVRALASVHLEAEETVGSMLRCRLSVTDGAGDRYDLAGETLATVPVRHGGWLLRESLTRFRLGEREANGLVESLD